MNIPVRLTIQGQHVDVNCPFRRGSRNRHLFVSVLGHYVDQNTKLFHTLSHPPVPCRAIPRLTGPYHFWQGYDLEGSPEQLSGTDKHAVHLAGRMLRYALDRMNIVEFQLQTTEDLTAREV